MIHVHSTFGIFRCDAPDYVGLIFLGDEAMRFLETNVMQIKEIEQLAFCQVVESSKGKPEAIHARMRSIGRRSAGGNSRSSRGIRVVR